jgi:predicted dinucleotide-binding enzyme
VKIGIIGAGSLGTAIAKRLVLAGHDVMLSFSRDRQRLNATAKRFGAQAGSVHEAVEFSEVVALVVPWQAVPQALDEAGALDSKILWDCTNGLNADFSGLELGFTTSAGEWIQSRVPAAKVVKGIPPFADLLHADDPTIGGIPAGAFVCGDDPRARATVRSVLEALPTRVTDAGSMDGARYVEPTCYLLLRLALQMKMGPRIGGALLTESWICPRAKRSQEHVDVLTTG